MSHRVFVVSSVLVLATGIPLGWLAASSGNMNQDQRVNEDGRRAATAPAVSRAPSTLPLRWRVAYARLQPGFLETYCNTAVVVENLTDATVDVEVEWINTLGSVVSLRPLAVPGGDQRVWVPDDALVVNPGPFFFNDDADLGSLTGYAHVHASDPRVLASAALVCRSDAGNAVPVVSTSSVPTHAVGSTFELFQAGSITGHGTPVASPESE